MALFTVNSAHLHYNEIEHVCEAISGYFVVLARNCLASTLDNIVMQMRKINREKGYSVPFFLLNFVDCGRLLETCTFIEFIPQALGYVYALKSK